MAGVVVEKAKWNRLVQRVVQYSQMKRIYNAQAVEERNTVLPCWGLLVECASQMTVFAKALCKGKVMH